MYKPVSVLNPVIFVLSGGINHYSKMYHITDKNEYSSFENI